MHAIFCKDADFLRRHLRRRQKIYDDSGRRHFHFVAIGITGGDAPLAARAPHVPLAVLLHLSGSKHALRRDLPEPTA
jgi:hypothetical protein